MKIKNNIILMVLLTIAFQWSCDSEPAFSDIGTENDITINQKARGGNGNGNGGGNNGGGDDTPSLYEVVYTGAWNDGNTDIITSDKVYMEVTENSGKITGLHRVCTESTTLYGLNTLFTYLTPSVDCYDNYECSWSVSMTQFNKKKMPDRLKATFWFEDPAAPGGNPRFTMWGTINGEFLPTSSNPTTIEFDKWQVDYGTGYSSGDPACEHENTFFSDDNIPHQSMSIILLENPDVESLCASKPGCTN